MREPETTTSCSADWLYARGAAIAAMTATMMGDSLTFRILDAIKYSLRPLVILLLKIRIFNNMNIAEIIIHRCVIFNK